MKNRSFLKFLNEEISVRLGDIFTKDGKEYMVKGILQTSVKLWDKDEKNTIVVDSKDLESQGYTKVSSTFNK
jgi:hypothetical protein